MQEIAERLPLRFFQFCVDGAHGLKETGYLRAPDFSCKCSVPQPEPEPIYNLGDTREARASGHGCDWAGAIERHKSTLTKRLTQ